MINLIKLWEGINMNNFNPDALAMIGPDFEESFSQGETKIDIEPRTVSAVVSTYVSTVFIGSLSLASWASATTSK